MVRLTIGLSTLIVAVPGFFAGVSVSDEAVTSIAPAPVRPNRGTDPIRLRDRHVATRTTKKNHTRPARLA